MAEKNVQYKLSFVANTQQAKESLNSLNSQLSNLGKNLDITKPLSTGVRTALNDVARLQTALQNAVNVDTGALDFSKLSKSFHSSNLSLEQLRKSMARLGPDGRAAFNTLAQSIIQAEIPLKRSVSGLNKLGETLKNTAKWQISSAILQGFTSSIREAYTYAQDLNKTLTDIKIVSDLNNESLEKFAKTANQAAKRLSTTTKEYTKASLIFFQQGLGEQEVLERTDAVIKMANVTGEAASEVSSYMTAIWNNFDDGSQSLEHYADVITALGAATASSSEEIAGGLEKFAAIAETVGLSYEYATAALATVVAETRQSEDTVGTAFKTIFGRLQSLNLGESLDDDTTLTKYSNALMSVGVSIKQANGELKGMDQILDELGAKWNTLSQDEQVALANTVAGTRQYSNFMALMNNYQDAFKTNLNTAYNAQGELNKQADEYAESWEAARNRVKASAEGIYNSLFNSEDFIEMTNGFAKFLDNIDVMVRSLGGLQGIIPLVGASLLGLFGHQVSDALREIKYNIDGMTGALQKQAMTIKQDAFEQFKKNTGAQYNWFGGDEHTYETAAVSTHAENQMRIQNMLFKASKNINEEEQQRLNAMIGITNQFEEQLVLIAKQQDKLQEEKGALIANAHDYVKTKLPTSTYATAMGGKTYGANQRIGTALKDAQARKAELNEKLNSTGLTKIETAELQSVERLIDKLSSLNPHDTIRKSEEAIKALADASNVTLSNIEKWDAGVAKLDSTYQAIVEKQIKLNDINALGPVDPTSKNAAEDFGKRLNTLSGLGVNTEAADQQLAGLQKLKVGTKEYEQAVAQLNTTIKTLTDGAFEQLTQEGNEATEQFRKLGQEIGLTEEQINELISKMRESAGNIGAMDTATKNYNQRLKELENEINNVQAKMHDWASVMVGTMQSAMGLFSAIRSLQSIGDIWSDDSLTWGEKLLSILTTTTSATMSLMMAYKGLGPIITNITNLNKNKNLEDEKNLTIQKQKEAQQKKEIVQGKEEIAVDEAGAAANEKDAISENSGSLADKVHNEEMKKAIALEKEEISSDSKGIVTDLGEAGAEKVQGDAQAYSNEQARQGIITGKQEAIQDSQNTIKNLAEGASEGGGKSVTKFRGLAGMGKTNMEKVSSKAASKAASQGVKTGVTAGGKSTMAVTGASGAGAAIGAIAAIAGGVLLIAAASAIAVSIYNQEAKAAESARANAEAVQQSYSQVKSEVEGLQNSIKNLKTTEKDLSTMTKGTDEWREAISKANDEAKQLMKSVKGLKYTVDGNGMIKFEEGELDRANKELSKKKAAGEAMSLEANRIAKERQIAADKTKFNRDKINGTGGDEEWAQFGNFMAATTVGAGGGALIGLGIAGPWGALAGAIIGGVAGMITGGVGIANNGAETGREKEALDTISKGFANLTAAEKEKMFATREETVARLQQMGVDETLIDSLADNREALEELVRAEDELRIENIKLTKAILGEAYQEEAEEYGFGASAILSAMSKETQKDGDLYQEYLTKLSVNNDGWGADKDWKEAISEVTNNQYKVTKAGGKKALLERWNEEEQKWEKVSEEEMDEDDINEMIAKAMVTSSLTTKNFEDVADKYDIEGLTGELKNAFGLTDADLLKENNGIYQEVLSDWVLGENIDLTDLTYKDISDVLTRTSGQDTDFEKAIYEAASNYETALKEKNIKASNEWHEKANERAFNDREAIKQQMGLSDADYEEYLNLLAQSNNLLTAGSDITDAAAQKNLALSTSIGEVNKVLSDNVSTLLTADKTSAAYIQSLSKVAAAMSTAFGGSFDSAYIEKNLDTIIAAAEGDTGAIRDILQDAAVSGVDKGNYNAKTKETLTNFVNNNNAALDNVAMGTSLGHSGLTGLEDINKLVASGDVSAEQMTAYLKQLGYDVKTTKDSDGKTIIDLENTKYVGTETFSAELGEIGKGKYNNLAETERQLNKIGKQLDDISKKKDKAFGKQKLSYIDQEIAKLDEEYKLYEAQGQVLEENLKKSKDSLNEKLTRHGFSAVYDEKTGEIKGFQDAEGNDYTYNELMEDTRFKYMREDFEAIYNEYNNGLDQVAENSEVKADVLLNIEEAEWEKIELTRELQLFISEESIKRIEHTMERLGDAWDKAGLRMTSMLNLSTEYWNQFYTYYQQYNDLITKYEGKDQSAWDEADTNQLTQILDNMRASESEMRQLLNSAQDDFSSAISEVNDELENQKEYFTNINNLMNSYKNTIDLLGKSFLLTEANDLITEINDQNLAHAKDNITITQAEIKANDENLAKAKASLEQALAMGDDSIDFWLKEIETLEAKGLELTTTLSEQFAEALEAAATVFESEVENIIKNLEHLMASSFGSLEYMQYAYDQEKKINDLYLEEYEKQYELSKVLRQVTKDIDNASNLSDKEKLRSIEQDIHNLMVENVQVSEQDLDILQKRYELKKAEIELESAKNSKTQVQMVQSATGAWAYVYRANEEKIDEATQNYEDKLYALQKANDEYIDKWTSSILTLESTFGEGLNNVMSLEYKDTIERNEAIKKYLKNSLTEFKSYANGLQNALGTNNLSGTIFSSFGTIDELVSSFSTNATEAIDNVLLKQEAFDAEQQDILNMFTEDNAYNYFNDNLSKIANTSADALNETLAYGETLQDTYGSLANNLIAVQGQIETAMKVIKATTDDATESISDLLAQLTGIEGVATGVFITGSNNEVSHNTINGAAVGYDTGGYTGAWGSEGKVALLHEKELVLNKDDTSNMLKAIEILRNNIDTYALQSLANFDAKAANMISTYGHTYEQEVHITAEFPNAINHSEIEQAFENMVNMATQYANRK